MRVVNENFETITEYDLSKGYLTTTIVIREDAEPIDDINKFAWADEDYEEVQMYVLYPPMNNIPTWQDRIEAQVTYTAIITDSLLPEEKEEI